MAKSYPYTRGGLLFEKCVSMSRLGRVPQPIEAVFSRDREKNRVTKKTFFERRESFKPK